MSIMREQRYTNTRVMIATQEPARCPELMALSDATFIHKTVSPAQVTALQHHLGGTHTTSKASIDERQLSDRIASLETGESLVFCPAARLTFQGDQDGISSPTIDSVPPLGGRIAKIRTRRRPGYEGNKVFRGDHPGDGKPAEPPGGEALLLYMLSGGNDAPEWNYVPDCSDDSDGEEVSEQNDDSDGKDDLDGEEVSERNHDSDWNDDDCAYDDDWDFGF